MLVTIIVVFALCWAPISINNVLVAFGVLPELHIGMKKFGRNSVNIIISSPLESVNLTAVVLHTARSARGLSSVSLTVTTH